jgi:chaperonin cofactor prefoldin
MSGSTELEKQSLEHHVELCSIRYSALETRLNKVEEKLDEISDNLRDGNSNLIKVSLLLSASLLSFNIL